jgi:hypothetical protein
MMVVHDALGNQALENGARKFACCVAFSKGFAFRIHVLVSRDNLNANEPEIRVVRVNPSYI